jgi:uncharacterized protein CbrC (UPF0167 family)
MLLKSARRESSKYRRFRDSITDKVASIVNPAYVRTSLLKEVLENPGFKLFVLEPETVADAVVKQLHSGNGGHIILPARYAITCGLRGWPSWLQELARNTINKELAFLGTRGREKVAGMGLRKQDISS